MIQQTRAEALNDVLIHMGEVWFSNDSMLYRIQTNSNDKHFTTSYVLSFNSYSVRSTDQRFNDPLETIAKLLGD